MTTLTTPATRGRWDAIGTTCEVLTLQPELADAALRLAQESIARLDDACTRFRSDSELSRLPHGREVTVSSTLNGALAAALSTARRTDGLVDPTVGTALRSLGYDDDLDAVLERGDSAVTEPDAPVPGWWRIQHDPRTRTVLVPRGVELDLGASAKAWAADRIATMLADRLPGSFLVNLGGDLAVAGPTPINGWPVMIDDGSGYADPPVITVRTGAIATSSTTARTWLRAGEPMHHIVDPATGAPAEPVWRAVTVAAHTCEQANAAATASIVLGVEAPYWLARRGLHARLVNRADIVIFVGDWPDDGARTPHAVRFA